MGRDLEKGEVPGEDEFDYEEEIVLDFLDEVRPRAMSYKFNS